MNSHELRLEKGNLSFFESRMAERLVWFLLVDQAGVAYKGTSADCVNLPSYYAIAQFRDVVITKYADSHLKGIAPSDLLVYADKTAFDANTADVPTNLQPEDDIGVLGTKDAKMYVVVIPDQEPTVTSGVAVQINPPTAPHPHRLQRWSKINHILARNKNKKARTDEGGFITPYSSSRWTAVGPVFDEDRINYAEYVHPIPASDLEVLSKVLTWIMKCFGWTLIDLKDNEAKRLHVIAPILWAVVQLLPDVTIYIQQDLDGNRVDAHGHFEFVLVRGDKRICIVEAKEEKFKQGMAQALLGCEVAADLDDSHEVYAAVTNVEKWIFLKSLDEEILCDEITALTLGENGVPHATQLRKFTGKLHSMLTDQRLEQ